MPANRPHSRSISQRDVDTAAWDRNFGRRSNANDSSNYRDRIMLSAEKIQRNTMSSYRRANDSLRSLTFVQRALLALAAVFGVAALVLFLRFGESVFAWIAPLAERWRGVNGGWMVLWLITFVVGMPPLIGWASCVTVAGFVYGLWKGWAIVASATILGSTASFLLSRHFYSGFVNRLVAHDRRFAALALTLKHDGLKLLVMIRLCPLPYSLLNGALATFHTVTWQSFMAATAIASPQMLIHVFIGSRLGAIADNMDEMDAGTRFINWMSILLSFGLGIVTAFVIYRQTKVRAEQLEALERAAGTMNAGVEHEGEVDSDYGDDYNEHDGILNNGNINGNQQRYADIVSPSAPVNALRLQKPGSPLRNMEAYTDGSLSPEYRDRSSSEERR